MAVYNRKDGLAVIDDKIGHHSFNPLSRGKGRNALQFASYITGETIKDEVLGKTYGRKKEKGKVLATEIVGPKNLNTNTKELWSEAEKANTKKNNVIAFESVYSLPSELSLERQKALARGMCLHIRDTYGGACEFAIHEPDPDALNEAQKNIHLHIIETSNEVSADENGKPVFGKKIRKLQDGSRKYRLKERRKEWAKRLNSELKKAGSKRRVDHRSFAERVKSGDAPNLIAGTHENGRILRDYKREKKKNPNLLMPENIQVIQKLENVRIERNALVIKKWNNEHKLKKEEMAVIKKGKVKKDNKGEKKKKEGPMTQNLINLENGKKGLNKLLNIADDLVQ